MQNYINLFTKFQKSLKELDLERDEIQHHWFHFLETTCDCEGCREDNKCILEINFEDE